MPRPPALLAAFVLLAGVPAVSAVSPEVPPSSSRVPSARALVEAYNARPFGSPGWRRIFLELENGGTVARTFTVLHLFRTVGEEVRSLVLLEKPEGLAGTCYLLVEGGDRRGTGMALHLHLPAGQRRVLTILPSRFDEGLLGSDFGYRDLRWRLPTRDHRLRVAGRTRLLGRPVWIVESVPASAEARAGSAWSRILYYLAEEPRLLLGADFYRAAERGPAKRLRIEEVRREGTVWTPTRMVMRLAGGRASVLTLREAGFMVDPGRFPAALFVPETLPDLAGRVAKGELGDLGAKPAPPR